MIAVHLLTLGSWLKAQAFEQFAHKQYLPALRRDLSPGSVVRLLRRRRASAADLPAVENRFLLIVESPDATPDLAPVADRAVQLMFEAHAPVVDEIGRFESIAQNAEEEA